MIVFITYKMFDITEIMIAFFILLSAPFVLSVAKSFVIVPQGFEYTLERFGRYIDTLKPGFHFLIPFIDRIARKIEMKEIVLDVLPQAVITKDNAVVTADGVVFFRVFNAQQAAYNVQDLRTAIQSLTMSNIRTVMGSMDLDELLSHRETINGQLLAIVNNATQVWGTEVTRIQVKDIHPPQDIVTSMARQMKAEREKRAQILEAEGHRQAAILKAEGEKQSKILEAEGERESKILEAEGEKEAMILEADARKESALLDAIARERLAQAEATATKLVSQAIEKGDERSLKYFVMQKYVEAFKTLALSDNQKIIMIPYEASTLVSSLTSMLEMKKNIDSEE